MNDKQLFAQVAMTTIRTAGTVLVILALFQPEAIPWIWYSKHK